MNDSSLSKESTIYSYTLIRKIRHSRLPLALYWGLLALFALAQSWRGGWLWLLASLPGTLALQTLLVRLCLQMAGGEAAVVWRWRFGFVWNGVLPEGLAPLPLVSRIQRHALWIGLAAIGALYPWLPDEALADLLFVHIWVLAPRSWVLQRLRRSTRTGLLKINPQDTSCYIQ